MAVKNKIFIPTLISSVDYQPVRTLPHIYFYNGLKDCEDYYIQHYPSNSTSSIQTTVQNKFPYLDYYDGLEPTTGSNSLLFYNETPPYGVTPTGSLYTQYWDKYVSLLYNPRTRLINASAIIPLADYFDMELNDIVQWRGNYYHLRAINDYNLKDGTCKIQLLGPILDGSLRITPIDCNFEFSSSFEVLATGGTTYDIWSGSYVWKMHEFSETGSSSFNVVTESIDNLQIMVIGGGGYVGDSGAVSGFVYYGGGGGAGGFSYQNNLTVSSGSYNVQVGRGGNTFTSSRGESGYSSSISGPSLNIAVAGGGGGGGASNISANRNGAPGASGGGGTDGFSGGTGIVGQGNNGGNGGTGGVYAGGGGGGGFSEIGSNGNIGSVGNIGGGRGGNGVSIRFSPWMTQDWYCGGGNGTNVVGYLPSGSGAGTPNNMYDLNRIGGGHGDLDPEIPAGTGIVRIMYAYRTYNPLITDTYRFTCNSLFGCSIQYVNTDGTLVDGEFLANGNSIDKVVPKGSQARITARQVIYENNPGITYANSGGTIQVL